VNLLHCLRGFSPLQVIVRGCTEARRLCLPGSIGGGGRRDPHSNDLLDLGNVDSRSSTCPFFFSLHRLAGLRRFVRYSGCPPPKELSDYRRNINFCRLRTGKDLCFKCLMARWIVLKAKRHREFRRALTHCACDGFDNANCVPGVQTQDQPV
jgi:hypothetical protein